MSLPDLEVSAPVDIFLQSSTPTAMRAALEIPEVDNTADADKPVSTAQAAAIAAVAAGAAATATAAAAATIAALKLDQLALPDDNTVLNATAGRHGLLQKLPGGTDVFLRGDGIFAVPPGTGGGGGGGGDGVTRPNIGITDLGTNFSTSTVLTLNKDHKATQSSDKTIMITGTPAEGNTAFLALTVTAPSTLTFPSSRRVGASDVSITAMQLQPGNYFFLWRYVGTTWKLTDSVNSGRVHYAWAFSPKAVNDLTTKVMTLKTVGDEAPGGFVITSWKFSFVGANPATQIDMDLKRADDYVSRANPALVDQLDTTAGVSSETNAANINGGAAIANGKVLYLELGTAYPTDNLQCIFELWGYPVS